MLVEDDFITEDGTEMMSTIKRLIKSSSENAVLKYQTAVLEDAQKASAQRERIISGLPETNVSKQELFALMGANGYSFEERSGKTVVLHNGAEVRNKLTLDPMPSGAVIDEFVKSKSYLSGRGAPQQNSPQQTGTVTFATFKAFEADWKAQGKSTNGAEFAAKAQKLAKNNPNFFK